MTEGTLCLFDTMHPRLIRQRLRSYLNALPDDDPSAPVESVAPKA